MRLVCALLLLAAASAEAQLWPFPGPGRRLTAGGTTQMLSATAGACGGGDVTAAVQTAVSALPNGGTLVFDCVASVSGTISKNSASTITITATATNGLTATGSPTTNVALLSIDSCTGCIIEKLYIDGAGKHVRGVSIAHSVSSHVRELHISNLGGYANDAIEGRANTDNKYYSNVITNLTVVLDGSGQVPSSGLNTRGMWIGEGNDYETRPEIYSNTGDTVWHTFIVCACTAGYVHDNSAVNLGGDGVKISLQTPSLAVATTIVENNSFSGKFVGTYVASGGETPLSGGGMQIGSCASPAGNPACSIADFNEKVIIRYNTFDGGQEGVSMVAGVYDTQVYGNVIKNQWSHGILITQRSTKGTILIHNNHLDADRAAVTPSTLYGTHPQANAIYLDAGSGVTLAGIEIYSNWLNKGYFSNLYIGATGGGTVSGLSVHDNSFTNSTLSWGLQIDQGGGTISLTAATNCYYGNNSGGLTDSRGILSDPGQPSPCSNPSGY